MNQAWRHLIFRTSYERVFCKQYSGSCQEGEVSFSFLWIWALLLMRRALKNWNSTKAKQDAILVFYMPQASVLVFQMEKYNFTILSSIIKLILIRHPKQSVFYTAVWRLKKIWFCLHILFFTIAFYSLLGMDTLNSAIESLMASSSKDDWMPVTMNVADATVTVINERVRQSVLF